EQPSSRQEEGAKELQKELQRSSGKGAPAQRHSGVVYGASQLTIRPPCVNKGRENFPN
ncbi:hypothetical protein CEXT_246791, partial [Caerostris extrusa]